MIGMPDGAARRGSRPSVLVVGDVMTDTIVIPEGPVIRGTDRRATIRQMPGGSGANQAAWLAAEGVRAVFAGRVGAGDHAQQTRLLAQHGVEPVLARDDLVPTGMTVTLSSDGERSFLTDRGANDRLSRADLPTSLLDGVDLVHVSGYSLFAEGPRAAVLELLAEARRRGTPFSIDPGSSSFLTEVGAENFLDWTGGARFAFPNEAEAAVLAGTSDPDAQLERLTGSYETVVIKRGAEGAIAAKAGESRRWRVAAPQVDPLDTSGAGDAFCAAFLAAHLLRRGDAGVPGARRRRRLARRHSARRPAAASGDQPSSLKYLTENSERLAAGSYLVEDDGKQRLGGYRICPRRKADQRLGRGERQHELRFRGRAARRLHLQPKTRGAGIGGQKTFEIVDEPFVRNEQHGDVPVAEMRDAAGQRVAVLEIVGAEAEPRRRVRTRLCRAQEIDDRALRRR